MTLPKRGPNDPTPYSVETDADVGLDWRNALADWVESHAYYPNQAAGYRSRPAIAGAESHYLCQLERVSVELERGSVARLALQGMFRGGPNYFSPRCRG